MEKNNEPILPVNDGVNLEEDLKEEKTWYAWSAPERAYKRRDKDFWISSVAMLVLVSVIFFFAKEFFLIIALISFLFLYYSLSSVPPRIVENSLTNRGVYVNTVFFSWADLQRFWFDKSMDHQTLSFETNLTFPNKISLLINQEDMEKIKGLVLKRLPLYQSPPSFVEKLTGWVGSRIPLEDKK